MKVVVIHNLKRGGALRRLQEQVSRLGEETVELTLGTATPVTDSPIVIDYEPHAPKVSRAKRPPLRYADALRLRLAWRRLTARADSMGADVIFANPCQFFQAPLVLLSAKLPTLYFCDEPRRVDHEPEATAARNPQTRGVYGPLYAWERRLDVSAVHRASRIAANSQYSVGRIRDAYGLDSAVVPMGVAEAFLHGPLDGPRADSVLSVGMLTPSKGHDLVVRAAARSKLLHRVVIVSPRADPAEQQRLAQIAGEVGVELEIRIAITDAELREEYERARVTAYLARGEPFGLAALEAQACGSPVVASDDAGLRETLIDGVTGRVVPRDPDAAASAFDALSDPETSMHMQAAAARHGRASSWDVSAARVRELLHELGGTR